MKKINDLAELKESGLYIIEDDETLVDNTLLQVLKEKELNPSDLAKLTGISRQNINAIIHNKMRPGIDSVLKISFVLGEDITELFQLTENAWLVPYKVNDTPMFIDVMNLQIVDNKEKRSRINKNNHEFYDNETGQTFTKTKHAAMQKEYVETHLEQREQELSLKHSKLSKTMINSYAIDELKREFNQRYNKIYKRLGQKMIPITIPKKKK